jgi:hypothetical protein
MDRMGSLNYDGHVYDFEDRFLAHVQVVLSQKMRRRESFLLSWSAANHEAWGRVSLWMNPSADVSFRYSGSRAATINSAWLERMMSATNSTRGLDLDLQREPPVGSSAQG